MSNYTSYRRRPQHQPATDLNWLRNARDALQETTNRVFPVGAWPLRTAKMDRLLKALGVLQHVLHEAIDEARREAGVSVEHTEPTWLGYPPPRR